MNYTLNANGSPEKKRASLGALKRLVPLMKGERRNIAVASVAILVNAVATLAAPVIIARAVDTASGPRISARCSRFRRSSSACTSRRSSAATSRRS